MYRKVREIKTVSKETRLTATAQVSFDDKILSDYRCTICQRHIRTIDRGDHIESEFCDGEGRCWDCSLRGA